MDGDKWNDVLLDGLRAEGDPLADAVIQELFQEQDLAGICRLIARLVENDDPVPAQLPEVVRRYFESDLIDDDAERAAEAGECFFALHGPEIMLVLCCCSLPFDYANARAVQVLYQTGFLAKRPNLRVAQTAQMIVDVMTPGGMSANGRGVRSAQKVRLMHAAVRCMILADPNIAWDRSQLGVPINQADLLYTLMSFTQVVLDGLARLDLEIEPRDAQAYLQAWCSVGRILGMDPKLMPANIAEAKALTAALKRRQHAPSQAGRLMTQALSGLVGDVLGPLRCFRWSLIRYFCGPELSKLLGVPRRFALDWMVSGIETLAVGLDALARGTRGGRRVFRWLSIRLIQVFIDETLGTNKREFRIPTQLHDDWKHRRAARPSRASEAT